MLSARNLSIGYPSRTGGAPRVVSGGLSLSLHRGELVCLIGPNGAGKSTLMRTLAAMQPPIGGQVLLGDADLFSLAPQERARRLAVVLTERVTAGLLTARELVGLGRHPYTDWLGRLKEEDEAAIDKALLAAAATDLAMRRVSELSDGERQRVMLARALAQEPDVLILDEITAFLDLPRRVDAMHILQRVAHLENKAVLLSSHDLDLALRTADAVWLISREGVLVTGAPEDLVLSGAFASTFAAEGVVFDPARGSFEILLTGRGEVSVDAEGIVAEWTRRALERAGFRLVADAPDRVRVATDGGIHQWISSRDGQVATHASIHELVKFWKTSAAQTEAA